MNSSKTYYGCTFFNKEGVEVTENNNKIELTYYTTKDYCQNKLKEESEVYGIEVVKKEYNNDIIKEEKNNINNITDDLEKVIEIIQILKKHKVTPIGLNDVMEDLLKTKQISQNSN